ncbi:hypothetical protein [Arthrobacter sp.]|uniref:hypothetical protein n=1 Tax=Arthrobacter sp. TaxID=1667 RepID=UPI003A95455E
MPWLEPDINDALADYKDQGTGGVVVVPIGFVSTTWRSSGTWTPRRRRPAPSSAWRSTACPPRHPREVRRWHRGPGLRTPRRARRERPAGGRASEAELGPWFDVCRPNCCAGDARRHRQAHHRRSGLEVGVPAP